jgi:hypothetical protein
MSLERFRCFKLDERAFVICVLSIPEENYIAFFEVVSDMAGGVG